MTKDKAVKKGIEYLKGLHKPSSMFMQNKTFSFKECLEALQITAKEKEKEMLLKQPTIIKVLRDERDNLKKKNEELKKQTIKEVIKIIEELLTCHRNKAMICCVEKCFCWDIDNLIKKLNEVIR